MRRRATAYLVGAWIQDIDGFRTRDAAAFLASRLIGAEFPADVSERASGVLFLVFQVRPTDGQAEAFPSGVTR